MDFSDFNIEINANEDNSFSVKVKSEFFGDGKGKFDLSQSVDELIKMYGWSGQNVRGGDARAISGAAGLTTEQPGAIGEKLFNLLFSSREVYSALAACLTAAEKEKKGVRLRLTMDTRNPKIADLARLPWELLCDKSKYDYFGTYPDFSISRYLEVQQPFFVQVCRTQLRILVVSSNPRKDLALDKELDNLKKALGGKSNIDIEFLEEATTKKINEKLAQGKETGQDFHVLHYMGHGGFQDNEGVLLLHGEDGGEACVKASTFNKALQASDSIRLVFLNACNTAESGGQDGSHPFAGVATALVFGGVPAVIAMQRPVPDDAAIALSRVFYSKIAQGRPVDEALSAGRREVYFNDDTAFDWAIPVLFMRSANGVLFDFADTSQAPAAPIPDRSTTVNAPSQAPEAVLGADAGRTKTATQSADTSSRSDDSATPKVAPFEFIQKRPPALIATIGVLAVAILAAAGYYLFGRANMVIVPRVHGLSSEQAMEKLRQLNLVVKGEKVVEAKDNQLDYGLAIRTSPDAGESAPQNGEVTLYVSGMKTLPRLDDEVSKEEATDTLKKQGFDNVVVQERPSSQELGKVLGTEPSAGMRVLRLDRVTLLVSGNKTAVPEVKGMSRSEAEKQITNANLKSGVVYDWQDGATLDTILRTDPGAGTQMDRASEVKLYVSAQGGWLSNKGVLRGRVEKDQECQVVAPRTLHTEPEDSKPSLGAVSPKQSVRILELGQYGWVKVAIIKP